jgi:hypothetical protein
MAEKEEVVQQTEEQAAAAFAEGFDSETPQPSAVTQPPVATTTTAAQPVPEEPKGEEPPAPKYAQITEEQLTQIMATVDKTASLQKGLDSVAGTVGNVRKALDQVRSQTPQGAVVEITDEDFAELKEDFPELAGHTRAALERILKRANLKGTGEPAPPTMDPQTVRTAAAEIVHQQGLADLNDLHPDWQTVVVSAEYRKWLGEQTSEYQDLLHKTYSATITGRSIDRFRAAQEAAKPKPAAPRPKTPEQPKADRRDHLRAAVQPRGNGNQPAPHTPPTPEENFRAGFNS